MNKNLKAFLDLIAYAEIGPQMLAESDNGYNVIAGSVPGMIITFSSYHRHPGFLVDMDGKPGGLQSTAAGRYQLLSRYWKPYCQTLKRSDFGKETQDLIALQQIKEQRATDFILKGKIVNAIDCCRNIWASFPGAGYGQPEKRIEPLIIAYRNAGGSLA